MLARLAGYWRGPNWVPGGGDLPRSHEGNPHAIRVLHCRGGSRDTKRTSLNFRAVYAVSKTWTITGGYAYEKFDYKDAGYEGYRYTIPVTAVPATSYLNGFYANPQYKANIIYALATYRF